MLFIYPATLLHAIIIGLISICAKKLLVAMLLTIGLMHALKGNIRTAINDTKEEVMSTLANGRISITATIDDPAKFVRIKIPSLLMTPKFVF